MNMLDTYSTMMRSIHGPKIKIATNTAIIFGIKANVCSWIEVVVWNTLTARPTRRPSPNIGAATSKTTIKACCGILDFTEGEILINGMSIKKQPLECKKIMAYIPDNPDLYEFMSGIRYLNFIGDVYGIPTDVREKRIAEYAEDMGITDALAEKSLPTPTV